jgi:seryl-tRNA synthetase
MLDIKFVRKNSEIVKDNLKKRGDLDKISWIDDLLSYDTMWRKLLTEINAVRKRRNEITREIGALKKAEKDIAEKVKEAEKIPHKLGRLTQKIHQYREKIDYILLRLPNLIHNTVPVGKNESDNVELRRWGTIPRFDFKPRDHIELSLKLDLIDLERAAKVAGSRFYYLKNELVQMNYALMNYALDFIEKKGFTLIQPPYAITRKAIGGAVALSDFEDMIYKVENEDLYLIATSEHAILAMHMNELLNEKNLPLRYAGISPCFRKEAGAHGRDTKGIFRVHQFEKIEEFVYCVPEDSWIEHENLLSYAEEILQKLKIPYRVVNVCSGDLGTVAAKKYDIEAWLPGQNKFREVVSCSNCASYQAVRSRIRYRDKSDEPTNYVHTLNSTLLAAERTMIAIIENNQQTDGSIIIPEVLIPYMHDMIKIERKR